MAKMKNNKELKVFVRYRRNRHIDDKAPRLFLWCKLFSIEQYNKAEAIKRYKMIKKIEDAEFFVSLPVKKSLSIAEVYRKHKDNNLTPTQYKFDRACWEFFTNIVQNPVTL